MNFNRFVRASVSVVLVILILAPLALAGPPLICWPFDIGDAKSLPFGSQNFHDRDLNYDTSRLVGDTLALLGPQTPVLVRMETMRRATIYVENDPRLAEELWTKLISRVKTAESKGAAEAFASFDAGYLLESYRQLGPLAKQNFVANAESGYSMVQRALKLRGNDSEMEFAAALMAQSRSMGSGREHLQRALAGAREGSLLAKNLVSHAQLLSMRGANIAELRASLDATKD